MNNSKSQSHSNNHDNFMLNADFFRRLYMNSLYFDGIGPYYNKDCLSYFKLQQELSALEQSFSYSVWPKAKVKKTVKVLSMQEQQEITAANAEIANILNTALLNNVS